MNGSALWYRNIRHQFKLIYTLYLTVPTVAVLAPLAQGRISNAMIVESFKSESGLLAILIGILVSWLASQGVYFLKETPSSVSSLIIGTIIGVCFFKGLAAGPLIAAGMVSMIVSFLHVFYK